MKAVITVIGKDKIGIIAEIALVLAKSRANILDISQTILQDYFTMIMIVDLEKINISFMELTDDLNRAGERIGMSIKVQHEEIFNGMHKI
ncbi:MAG: ACT domain-containing protein [Clostridia bacterium]|nr:ACT domain-containing protein [Clostridia bacterium]